MAEREGLPFLGSLPVDTELVVLLDAAEGKTAVENGTKEELDVTKQPSFDLLERYHRTSSWPLFRAIVEKAVTTITTTEVSSSATA